MSNIPQNDTPNKQCPRCKRILPATQDFFGKEKRNKNGLNYICRECRRTGKPSERPRKVDGIPEDCKRCTKCLEILPATSDFFQIGSAKRSGIGRFKSKCKKCMSKRLAKIADIPEGFRRCTKCKEILPATIEYFKKYPENFRGGRLHARCIKCYRDYSRVYNHTHVEDHRRYYWEHREETVEKQRRHRALHRDEINRKRRRDYQLHRGRYLTWARVGWQKRRMRKRNVEGSLTALEIRTKLKAQHYRCYYCDKKFEKHKGKHVYHLDHTIPLSRVEENPRHDINYVVLTCSHCNLSKRNKLPHEWPQGGRLM